MGDGEGPQYRGADRFHKSETPGKVSAKPKEDTDPPCLCEKTFGVECPEAASRLHALMDKQKELPKRIDVNNLPMLKEALIEAGVTPEFASAVVTERGKRRKKSLEKRKSKWKKKQKSFINLAGLLSVKGANGGDLDSMVAGGCYF